MPRSACRPFCRMVPLLPLLTGGLAFGAFEEAHCKKISNHSSRTVFLALGSLGPGARAAASGLAPGPGQGDLVPLDPPADQGTGTPAASLPLPPGEAALVYLDKPEAASEASATFRLQDADGKLLASFQFAASWNGGGSRLERLRETEQPELQPHCDGDSYELRPAPLQAQAALETKQPSSLPADKENFLTGTLVNQSGGPLRLFPCQKGMIVLPARTEPGDSRERVNPPMFVVQAGETVQLAQPLAGLPAQARNGHYLLLDEAAAIRIHLAWLGPRLAAITPGGPVPALVRGARDRQDRVQAARGTLTILGLEAKDSKDSKDPKAPAPAAARQPALSSSVPAPDASAARPAQAKSPAQAKPAAQGPRQRLPWHPNPGRTRRQD